MESKFQAPFETFTARKKMWRRHFLRCKFRGPNHWFFKPGGIQNSISRCAAAQIKANIFPLTWCEALSSVFVPQGDPPGRLRRFLTNFYVLQVFLNIEQGPKANVRITFNYIFKYISSFQDQSSNLRQPFEIVWARIKMVMSKIIKFRISFILSPVGIQNQFFAALPRKIKEEASNYMVRSTLLHLRSPGWPSG